ncbi:MAG: TetR/AcrR family transcriptional regulator [Chloroflexota bacterium]
MPKPDVSDERIPQILHAAAQMFSQYGIDGTSMAQIAKSADVSKAMIYYYFDSKEALVSALVRNLFDADQAGLDELIESNTPALERMTQYMTDLADLLESNAVLYPIFAEFKARSARSEDVQRIMQAYFSRYVDAFAQIIQQGIDTGHVRPQVDPEKAALALTALVEGCIVLRHNLGYPIATLLSTSIETFLEGLAT